MIFHRTPRPVREFSLAELVAKISELERRQRGADETPDRERRETSTWSQVAGLDAGLEPELTE